MPPGLTESLLDPADADAAADLINLAYNDWRRLRRVDAKAVESPARVSAQEILRAGERGDIEWSSSLIVRDGGEPVGLMTLGADEPIARLGWLAVHPDYRRRGLGRSLLKRAIGEASVLGCSTLATASYIDSRYEPAVRLLESSGMLWAEPDHCNMTMLRNPDIPPPGEPVLREGFSLRTWEPGDQALWTRLKNECFGDTTPLGWWQSVFGDQPWFDPRGWFFLLHGDRPIGMSAAVLPRHPETGELLGAQIDWVGVLTEFRGLGLGRAIVVACINFALQFDPDLFVLITQRFRTAAVALYESLGFRSVMDWRHYRLAL